MESPKRKPNRLTYYDYSTPGAYFITICVENRRNILGRIVGGGALDAPQMQLSRIGKIVKKYIQSGERVGNIHVDKYVIMPNHIHLILMVENGVGAGTSRAPSPTNALIPRFVAALKRLCHKELGEKIFQRSYHDHVIRDEKDYLKIWRYIDGNPSRWYEDCFYVENEADEQCSPLQDG